MFKDIKGAIFDLDGTLIDSMWLWSKIDAEYLKKHNLQVPEDLKENLNHLCFKDCAKYFKTRFNLPYTPEEIESHWIQMALQEYSTNISLKPGAKKFLQFLKNNNIKIALATSNRRDLANASLKLNDIANYFDCITTTDEVPRGKNFPDVYLLAANRLGVNPENCIVFEDILLAVKGAHSAGMKVIAVYDEFSKNEEKEITTIASKYIHNYDELLHMI